MIRKEGNRLKHLRLPKWGKTLLLFFSLCLFFLIASLPVLSLDIPETSEKMGKFIDSRAAQWPELLAELEQSSNTLSRWNPFLSSAAHSVFSHSALSRIVYHPETDALNCYFFDFLSEPETSRVLQYNPMLALAEIDKEHRRWESEWQLIVHTEKQIRWESGNQWIIVEEIRPDWFLIDRYLPT